MKQAMTLTTGAAGDTAITCPCSRLVYTENHIDVVCPDCGRRYTRNVVWIMLDESPPDLFIHITDGIGAKDKVGG